MIKLQMIGHLGKDALKGQVNGKSVLNFNVAHSEKYRNIQGQEVERTTWVECSYWEREAVGPYLRKGVQVFIEGQPYLDQYVNKKGETATTLRMRVTNLQLLGKRDATAHLTPEPVAAEEAEAAADMPF